MVVYLDYFAQDYQEGFRRKRSWELPSAIDCMLPIPDLPYLRVVPLESLVLHEQMDERRAPPLVDALQADGVLRNPPIVHPISDRAERYVVLDGANRSTAFRMLGVPHILVQVVHAGNTSVQIETWNHVL